MTEAGEALPARPAPDIFPAAFAKRVASEQYKQSGFPVVCKIHDAKEQTVLLASRYAEFPAYRQPSSAHFLGRSPCRERRPLVSEANTISKNLKVDCGYAAFQADVFYKRLIFDTPQRLCNKSNFFAIALCL